MGRPALRLRKGRLKPLLSLFLLLFFLESCQATREPPLVKLPATGTPAYLVSSPFPTALPTSQTPASSSLPQASATLISTATPAATLFPNPTPSPSPTPAPVNREGVRVSFQPWELALSVAWSPDGQLLAVAAGDRIYLVEAKAFQILGSFSAGAFSYSLAYSPDGRLLAACSRDGFIRMWLAGDLAAAAAQSASTPPQPALSFSAHRKGCNTLAFSPDSRLLASGGDDSMTKVWDVQSGKVINQIIGGSFAVPGIAFRTDGSALAILNGPVIRLREAKTGRMFGTLRGNAPFYSVAFSPDGRWLALGDSDNTVRVWPAEAALNRSTGAGPAPEVLKGHTGQPGTPAALVWALGFSPSSRWLASAGGDGTVRIWDVESASLLETLSGPLNAVTGLAFSPDGRVLTASSLDAAVYFYQINSGE